MSSTYRIADLTLDIGRRQLLRDGKKIPLGPLTYKLLVALVDKAPELATHDDIADAVWQGRAVSPETVKQRVKLLRDALADDAEHPRYIEVVRGQGYRLLPSVNAVTAIPQKTRKSRWLVATAIGAILVIVATRPWFSRTSIEAQTGTLSLAVLPFVDMSAEQNQDYFANGVSEEIRSLLSKVTPIKVIARTSVSPFGEQGADVATIAQTLSVSHVLEGSVRKWGNDIRITVNLVDVTDSTQVWSESYDKKIDDILTLQASIATSVADALEVKLLHPDLLLSSANRHVNDEAFDLYLLGKQNSRTFSLDGLAKAEGYFARAIELDPDFIPAYYNLGLVYVMQILDTHVPIAENLAKLRDVVYRGLERAPDDPGLIGLSGQLARYDGDNDLAEQRLRRAMNTDPSNIPIRIIYGMFKIDRGFAREAIDLSREALHIDPLNPALYINIAFGHIDTWNDEEAIKTATRLEDIPGASGLWIIPTTKVLFGDLAGSIRVSRQIDPPPVQDPEQYYGWPHVLYYLEDFEKADATTEQVREIWSGALSFYALDIYRHLVYGEFGEARNLAVTAVINDDGFSGYWGNEAVIRVAIDTLIERGEAQRAVNLIEDVAPVYASYRTRRDIDAQEFFPAPMAVKSYYSSYPAKFFPGYIRALCATGDDTGADNMLGHLEAILQLRRDRHLFIEERHAAEAFAFRGQFEAALEALEQAEKDGTIYYGWHLFVLHNPIFADMTDHPRFMALIERIRDEMARQRAQLADPL